jgi:hypothetical protein
MSIINSPKLYLYPKSMEIIWNFDNTLGDYVASF